jgi:coenzyme F420-dependent glucose-6-phosphate dehydrogenase
VIDAYKAACEDAGKEPGEIVIQLQFSWAEDDDAALEGARVWKGAQPDEHYTDDWHHPRKMFENGERHFSDDDLKEALIISSDPEVHAERIREAQDLGATTMALMNVSGADPHKAIEVYGGQVLRAVGAVARR